MPWTVADVDEHKKGLTDAQKKRWVKIANSALKRCQDEGGEDCEASAIKQANSVAGKQEERAVDYKGYITSTNSALISVNAIDVGGQAVPVAELVAAYEEKTKTVDGKSRPAGDFLVVGDSDKPSTWHLPVKKNGKPDHKLMGAAKAALTSPGGHRGNKYQGPDKAKATSKLKALYKSEDMAWNEETAEMGETVLGNTEEIAEAVSGSLRDYANRVEDSFRSAFGRKGEGGLSEGPWGRDVFKDDPDLGTAIVVNDNGKMYAVEYSEGDDGFTFVDRGQWQEVTLTYKKVGTSAASESEEITEVELAESASGHALGLAEAEAGIGAGPRAPLLMDVALISPGWGNKTDGHYYPEEVLKRDAKVFEGVKMYATDHRPEEKSVRTEVAVIKACPTGFTGKGAPIARVAVHDGDFAEQARNRHKLDTLSSLECSILALGRTKKGEVDGEEANIVEAITKGQSVDWVTKAGAGGHALNLAESDEGGVNMDKEQIEKLLSESGLPQDAQERLAGGEYENEEAVKEAILKEQAQEPEAPRKLAEAEVEKLVEATKLPGAFKAALKAARYDDEAAAKAAIAEATEEVKKLTGSGKVFAQGDTQPVQDKPLSEKDRIVRFNEIMDRVGGRQVPVPAEQ